MYHFDSFVRPDLKKWLWGSDITRYSVIWNEKEYIDYSDGIANPRQPKFFNGKRVLVREITNPSIYAGYTEEELYNDPSIIIVLDNPVYSIKSLLGIMNSRLATFFHFNNSPKAMKGAFPKLLVRDIKEFPLPNLFSNKALETIIDYLLFLTKYRPLLLLNDTLSYKHVIQYFEEIIDAIVFEMYFSEEFHNAGIDIIRFVQRDFISIDGKCYEEALMIIKTTSEILREKDNEIRQNLKLMDTRLAEFIMPIKTSR